MSARVRMPAGWKDDMANYSRQMASAIATMTKTAIGKTLAWTPATAAERPRSVSEILDVRETFVCGYPQKADAHCAGREIA